MEWPGVDRKKEENDVYIHIAEEIGDRGIPVKVSAIEARTEVDPLRLIGDEMNGLLRPFRRNPQRLPDKHLVDEIGLGGVAREIALDMKAELRATQLNLALDPDDELGVRHIRREAAFDIPIRAASLVHPMTVSETPHGVKNEKEM